MTYSNDHGVPALAYSMQTNAKWSTSSRGMNPQNTREGNNVVSQVQSAAARGALKSFATVAMNSGCVSR
eukprot:m.156682 g.156682  ORF g.156682 m.156682 type:complete len:69 (+) comp14441_c0_seq3:1469-1675(+)